MALVKCESCGKEISSNAFVCPSCGTLREQPKVTRPASNLDVAKLVLSIVFLFAGVLSLIFGIVSAASDDGYYVSTSTYGGDAYTGIQNAAAYTAKNVQILNDITKNGFAFVLIITSIVLLGLGTYNLIKTVKK